MLTPHDREFARLAGEAPGADRVGAALRLAAWINAVVLLKGDRTIVATPDGEAWANPTGTLGAGHRRHRRRAGRAARLAARRAVCRPERAAVAAAYAARAGRAARRPGDGPVTAPRRAPPPLRPVVARASARADRYPSPTGQ